MPLESYQVVVGIIVALIVLTIAVGFIVILVSHSNRKTQLFLQEKKNLYLETNEKILTAQMEMQEQTLQHISRELHDNFGHIASLIKINLTTLKLEEPERARAQVEDTKELTRNLITDIKALSVTLNSDRILQTGLPAILQYEVNRLNMTGLFTASFTQEGEIPALPDEKLVMLYRISQEVINNMVKHSQASQINILLRAQNNLITLAFSDNGAGFDVAQAAKKGGAGLLNLRQRASRLNADLEIDSKPGNGTRITIILKP